MTSQKLKYQVMENEIGQSGFFNQQGKISKRKNNYKNFNVLSNKFSHSSITPENQN